MSKLAIATFTNLGFRWHARSFEPIDADMAGKTIIITGATGGLGLATAKGLSGLGADLVLVGRDEEKLASARASLGGKVTTHRADLSLLVEIRALADRILATEPGIDVLVNNVGVLYPEPTVTAEGLEASLATNLAGHFLLTNLLSSCLVDSAPSRVISITSGGMYAAAIEERDLTVEPRSDYGGAAAYAWTKRGQVILTEMWAERLAPAGVVVHSMHPGWAATPGVESSLPTFNRLMGPLLRTPEQGADTIVWLAAAAEPGTTTGQFWFDRRVAPTHLRDSSWDTPQMRQQLWAWLSELTSSDLPVGGR